MAVPISKLSPGDVEAMRDAGALVRELLDTVEAMVEPGVTTNEIDAVVHDQIIANGAYPACLGYMGFPKSCCTSVNEVVCHGIPNDRALADGDLVNVDIVAYLNGHHGDASRTFMVGKNVDEASRALVRVTEESLNKAIEVVGPGVNLTEVGNVISTIAEAHGYGIVHEFTGHGLGAHLHIESLQYRGLNSCIVY